MKNTSQIKDNINQVGNETNHVTIAKAISQARKIVIKIGSNTLAQQSGEPNSAFMAQIAAQCRAFMDAGKHIVLVSSGAQVSGLATLHEWARKRDVHYRQALCAIGQVELMNRWRDAFAQHDLHIGQLLLTKDDFEDDHRTLNIRNTLFTLVDEGVVPIINENDSVSFDEIKIGDNDNLSALVAILWSADLLILFSDIDGVFTDNPKTNPDAQLVATVTDVAALRSAIKIGETNAFGTGGIETKLAAAEKVMSYGIPMLLANGSGDNVLSALAEGKQRGTLFLADETSLMQDIRK